MAVTGLPARLCPRCFAMIRIIVLYSFIALSACSVTSEGERKPSDQKTDPTRSDTDSESKSNVASKADTSKELAKLLETLTKESITRHKFDPAELQSLFTQSVVQAENTLDTELSGVRLITHDRREFMTAISAQVSKSVHLLPRKKQTAWIYSDAVQAIYDPDSDIIILNHRIDRRFPAVVGESRELAQQYLRFVMLHELVHAVDARKGRIKFNWSTVREMTNAAIVREGHAHYRARIMYSDEGCREFVRKYQKSVAAKHGEPSDPADTLIYYEVGAKFIDHLYKKKANQNKAGEELIDLAFDEPPIDEYQIIFADLYPDESRNKVNKHIIQSIQAIPMPWNDRGYKEIVTNTIDQNGFRNAVGQKPSSQLTEIIQGDGTVSYIRPDEDSEQNTINTNILSR